MPAGWPAHRIVALEKSSYVRDDGFNHPFVNKSLWNPSVWKKKCWRVVATVDGWNPAITTWDVSNPVNNRINYRPQLVSRISEPSTERMCCRESVLWRGHVGLSTLTRIFFFELWATISLHKPRRLWPFRSSGNLGIPWDFLVLSVLLVYTDVNPQNRGKPPKWMVYNGKPYLKWIIWWYPYFGNTHTVILNIRYIKVYCIIFYVCIFHLATVPYCWVVTRSPKEIQGVRLINPPSVSSLFPVPTWPMISRRKQSCLFHFVSPKHKPIPSMLWYIYLHLVDFLW